MLIAHDGKSPCVHPSARIAPNAVICGDVTVGAACSVGFGAVLTAESGPVILGDGSIVMDTAVVRGVRRHPVVIGQRVLVGPRAYLTGCTVEDEVFLATGVTVFNGAVVGRRSEVRINAVVHLRTRLAPETTVPIGWVAVGDPARLFPPERHEEIWAVQEPLDFPRAVFGVARPGPAESVMPELMPRYARALGRHRDDVVLDGDGEAGP
jgi:carbonic anhydrase/acetyltransferase-like protein (isoleucine patch superfamily)